MSAVLILLIIAIICWALAALPMPFASPVQLGWLGMVFWGISQIIR